MFFDPWFTAVTVNVLSVLKCYGGFLYQRAAQVIPVRARCHRVETQCAEDVPRAHLPAVVVAAQTVRGRQVLGVHDMSHPVLGLSRCAGVIVQIRYMVRGLIAVNIIAYDSLRG
jgi:hypothetical protein